MLTLAQTLGFIVGPIFQGVFTPLGSEGFKMPFELPLSMYTAPGWLNVFLALFNLILFMPRFFQDARIAAKEQMLLHGNESEKAAWKAIKPDLVVAWVLIFSLFVFVFNFVLLEGLTTALTMDQYAWTKKEALQNIAYIMTAGGVIACVTFLSVNPLCKRFKENDVLIYGGFMLMVFGRLVHIPYRNELPKLAYPKEKLFENGTMITFSDDDDEVLGCPVSQEWCLKTSKLGFPEFILGYMLTSVAYPIGLSLIQTIFSKVLGPRPQGNYLVHQLYAIFDYFLKIGNWMGIITNAGCLSRISGPICVIWLYTKYGPLLIFSILLVITIIPLGCLLILKERLLIESFKSIDSPKSTEMGKLNLESDKNNKNMEDVNNR